MVFKQSRDGKCRVPKCGRKILARRLCGMHYQRMQVHGSVTPKRIDKTLERFWSKVRKTDECWLWTGAANASGYGHFFFKEKVRKASRVSWELANGRIENGLFVLHRCDNPSCVRPDHLFLGTNKDNVADMIAKGRRVRLFGEEHGMAILTNKQVIAIREMCTNGATYVEAARRFSVHRNTARLVARREVWKHI